MNNILKLNLCLGYLLFFIFNLLGESVILFVVAGQSLLFLKVQDLVFALMDAFVELLSQFHAIVSCFLS